MRVESGPAKADRNWQLVRVVLFLGFAGYFVYDGAIGWPNKVADEAEKQLKAPDPFGGELTYAELEETPLKSDFEGVFKPKAGDGEGRARALTRDAVEEALGAADLVKEVGSNQTSAYYVSKWGYAAVQYTGDRGAVQGAEWHEWFKTKAEVQQQFYWALIPGLIALPFLWKLYKAVTLCVVVDDEGLVYDNTRIAFDQMVALRDYNPKGWIDLHYKAGDREKKLRLDNEKIMKFDEVVDAICQKTGFKNDVRAFEADLEAEAPEEDGDEGGDDGSQSTEAESKPS